MYLGRSVYNLISKNANNGSGLSSLRQVVSFTNIILFKTKSKSDNEHLLGRIKWVSVQPIFFTIAVLGFSIYVMCI